MAISEEVSLATAIHKAPASTRESNFKNRLCVIQYFAAFIVYWPVASSHIETILYSLRDDMGCMNGFALQGVTKTKPQGIRIEKPVDFTVVGEGNSRCFFRHDNRHRIRLFRYA